MRVGTAILRGLSPKSGEQQVVSTNQQGCCRDGPLSALPLWLRYVVWQLTAMQHDLPRLGIPDNPRIAACHPNDTINCRTRHGVEGQGQQWLKSTQSQRPRFRG